MKKVQLTQCKLGYGGTKTEMERLLKDAEKLTGRKFDVSNFADIVDAIHAIQVEMGVTGTTAQEASTTITGSWNATKAAWENLLVAVSDPRGNIKKATANLVSSAKTTLKNVLPTVRQAVSGFGDFVTEVAPMIGEYLPELISDFVPKFWNAGKRLLSGLGKGIFEGVKKIKWPTWSDVKKFAADGWEKIKQGVANLGGLIFGNNTDGSVKWPKWSEIYETAKHYWQSFIGWVGNAFNMGGALIFGRDSKGDVKWPTWKEIYETAKSYWKSFTGWVGNAFNMGGALIFGRDTEGKVKWPDWKTIKEKAAQYWQHLLDTVAKFPALVFGEDSYVTKALENVFSFLKDFGGWVLENADKVAEGIAVILGALTVKKLIGLAAINPLLSAVAAGALLVVTNWDLVKKKVEELRESLEEIERAFDPINDFFLRLQGGGNGALITGQIVDLSGSYMKVKALENVRGREAAEEYFKGTWLKNFEREMKSAGFSAEQIETALSKISLDMTLPEMNDFLEGLKDAQKAVEILNGTVEGVAGDYDVNFHINVDGNIPTVNESTPTNRNFEKSREGSFAKGAWDIPFDNYRAILHRNEMVLNATQARQYREGGGASGLLAAIQGMRNDLKNLTIQVDGKDFGRAVVAYGSQGVKNYIGGTNRKAQAGYGT